MVELVDTLDSKSSEVKLMTVQIRLRVPVKFKPYYIVGFFHFQEKGCPNFSQNNGI